MKVRAVLLLVGLAFVFLPACNKSPTAPSAQSASVTVTFLSITGAKAGVGYSYPVQIELRESAGVGATVTSVDFVITQATGVSSAHVAPADALPLTTLAARGTIASKVITLTDPTGQNGYATKIGVTVTLRDEKGNSVTGTQTGNVPALPFVPNLPTINSFTVDKTTITPGEVTTLRWSVTDANLVEITPSIGAVPLTGSIDISPLAPSTTYTLKAINADGVSQKTLFVNVNYPALEYRVSGSTSSVSVTYSDCNEGTAQQGPVGTPWSFTCSTAKTGQFLYISAQNQNASGSVTVQIWKRGVLFKSTTSSGAYVIATASGSY